MMLSGSGQSPPSETRGAISSWPSPRGRRFRCIDPSDVQSLRLISAVPGAQWRRCLVRAPLFVQSNHSTEGVSSPLLSSQWGLPPPPLLKSVESLFKKKRKSSEGVHTQTRCYADRFTDARIGGPTPRRPTQLGRELWEREVSMGARERKRNTQATMGRQGKALEWRLSPACCSSVAAESLPSWTDLFMNGGEWDSLYWQQQSGPHLTPPIKQQTQYRGREKWDRGGGGWGALAELLVLGKTWRLLRKTTIISSNKFRWKWDWTRSAYLQLSFTHIFLYHYFQVSI